MFIIFNRIIPNSIYQNINQLFMIMIKIEIVSIVIGLVLLVAKKLSHV
jgi:hypothetical protein